MNTQTHAFIQDGLSPVMGMVQHICEILEHLEDLPDTAAQVHAQVMIALRRDGFSVLPEYPQTFIDSIGNFRRGRIDLVAVMGCDRCAIEIDARKPRRRSLHKLLAFDGYRIVALRGVSGQPVDGIDAYARIPTRLASAAEREDKRTVGRL